jgi:4-carboxymuconolactone decarboxylase
MSRIPYPDESELDDDAREVLASLPPLNVMRMFAGAPATLRPMADLGRAILLQAELDPRLRELAILAVARACGSNYERVQHENVSRALGIPDEEIAATVEGRHEELDEEARLVVGFADEIARNVAASEERTAAVLELLGRRQATELVVCCAYYSTVARIIETCGVELEEKSPTAGLTADDAERYSGD